MVKNFGGNKTKGKSRKSFHQVKVYNIEDLKKIDGQEYAFVNNVLGDGRYELICYDKVQRMGIIRGKLKKQSSKIGKNSCVLVSLREFQDEKCDIIAIFNDDDINKLVANNEITESFSKEGSLKTNSDIDKNILNIENSINDTDDEHDSNEQINIDDDGINIDDI